MRFATLESAQQWAKQHGEKIVVEIGIFPCPVVGIAECYPGGRIIFIPVETGRIYQRFEKRLTPERVFEK